MSLCSLTQSPYHSPRVVCRQHAMSLDPAFLNDSFPHIFAASIAASFALLPSLSREEASFSVRSCGCAKRASVAPLPQSKRRDVGTVVRQLESEYFSPREQECWRYYSNVASEKPFRDVQPAPPNLGSPRVLWEFHNEALLAFLQRVERSEQRLRWDPVSAASRGSAAGGLLRADAAWTGDPRLLQQARTLEKVSKNFGFCAGIGCQQQIPALYFTTAAAAGNIPFP